MKKLKIAFLLATAGILSGCLGLPEREKKEASSAPPLVKISESFWKSTDGGQTWEVKNNVSGNPRTRDADFLSLAISPSDGNKILAGLLKGGMMKSLDGGETWEFSEVFVSDKVYGLDFDASSDNIVYATGVFKGRGKVFRSQDFGQTWEEIYTSPAPGPLVSSLRADKNISGTLFIGTSDNQALKSADGGRSWKNVLQGDSPILSIAIDSKRSNFVYLLDSRGGFFKSEDGGESFSSLSRNFSQTPFGSWNFSSVKVAPEREGGVYLAGREGLIFSFDFGQSWNRIVTLNDPGVFPVSAFALSSKNPNFINYASSQAAYASFDGGVNWVSSQFDLKKRPSVMEFDPSDEKIVYLGFRKN